MRAAQVGRLFVAIVLTVVAAPLAFFNGVYGIIGIDGAFRAHPVWSYPGVLAELVPLVLLFFSLGFAICIVVAWRWYFMARVVNSAR